MWELREAACRTHQPHCFPLSAGFIKQIGVLAEHFLVRPGSQPRSERSLGEVRFKSFKRTRLKLAGLALTATLAAIYGVARAAGLADLGRRVDLVERSVRRGEGDLELARALKRDAEGHWD